MPPLKVSFILVYPVYNSILFVKTNKSQIMSNKQLGMEKIRQVLRCYSQGLWDQKYHQYVNRFRATFKKYLQVFQRSGLDYEGVLSLSDQELSGYSTKRPG